MKILFLCYSLNVGGIETYILRFSKWVKVKHPEIDLHILCKSGYFGPYENEYRRTGVTLHKMRLGYLNLVPYLNFFKTLHFNKFDVICDFSGDFSALPLIFAYLAGVKQRFAFYRNSRDSFKINLWRKAYKTIMNRIVRLASTSVLSNSEAALAYYFPGYAHRYKPTFFVIPNGVTISGEIPLEKKVRLRNEIGIPANEFLVIHVGNARWEKNHEFIIKMANMCCKEDKVDFVLVGSGVKEKYEKQIKSMGINNIYFLGLRMDVFDLMQSSDLFIFPSLSEGQPNALIEAIVSGLPFMASDIDPIKEVLPTFWGTRWLFPPDNIQKAYSLLKLHLGNNFREDRQFLGLVQWCRVNYNIDKCFEYLFSILTMEDI